MKKIIIALLFVLIPAFCFAGSVQNACKNVISKKNAAAEGCSTSTDYIGDKGDYSAGTIAYTEGTMYCMSFQATTASCASGTLGRFFVAHHATNTDNVKGCVYTDKTGGTDNPGGSGDEDLIGCSAETTCSTDTATPTCTNGSNITGGVTKDAYYFLCLISDATTFDIHRVTTGRTVWTRPSYTYASPPATLTDAGAWTDSGTRDRGAYVEIY